MVERDAAAESATANHGQRDNGPAGNPASPEVLLLREGLGRVLRMRRTALGLTLQDVAVRAGVSVQYLSEVERGLKDASSEMIAAIAGALRLPLPEVLVLTARVTSPAVSLAAVPPAAAPVQGSLALAA